MTRKQVFQAMRSGNFTSVGSYPVFMLTADGGILHPKCAHDNAKLVGQALRPGHPDKQWEVIGVDVNWEDTTLVCDHCNQRVESTYAEQDSTE